MERQHLSAKSHFTETWDRKESAIAPRVKFGTRVTFLTRELSLDWGIVGTCEMLDRIDLLTGDLQARWPIKTMN